MRNHIQIVTFILVNNLALHLDPVVPLRQGVQPMIQKLKLRSERSWK